jgi:hypothetical protein
MILFITGRRPGASFEYKGKLFMPFRSKIQHQEKWVMMRMEKR